MEREMSRAEALSQSWISRAPANRSPIHDNTFRQLNLKDSTPPVTHRSGEVARNKEMISRVNVRSVGKLLGNLISSPNKCYTIHRRHDCLLDDFSRQRLLNQLSRLHASFPVGDDDLVDDIDDSGVNIGRSISILQIDRPSTSHITAQSGVMLHPVASSVLVYR